MKTIKKAQAGKKVVTKPVRKKPITPVDDYKNMKDPGTGKKGTMGGEGTTPPLGKGEKAPKSAILPKRKYVGGSPAKNGKTMKKAQEGMYIKGTTAAPRLPKLKKLSDKEMRVQPKVDLSKFKKAKPKAKDGKSMKKCKYGCK